jgi:uncharacterized membrane protein
MSDLFRRLAIGSFLGLLISLLCWITLAEHSENYPTAAWLVIAIFPLLFPLRGILHGKPYTHAWTSFLMLAYFAHGIGELYSASSFHVYAALEILFSLITFSASIIYIKLNAKLRTESQNQ